MLGILKQENTSLIFAKCRVREIDNMMEFWNK